MDSNLLGFSTHPIFYPNSINRELTPNMFSVCPESVKDYARKLREQEWRFYVVNSNRGICYAGHKKVITIPSWIYGHQKSEIIWYISHELAHAYDGCLHEHGPQFMDWLIIICPSDCIEHELGYKPRNAKAAGIGQFKMLDL